MTIPTTAKWIYTYLTRLETIDLTIHITVLFAIPKKLDEDRGAAPAAFTLLAWVLDGGTHNENIRAKYDRMEGEGRNRIGSMSG